MSLRIFHLQFGTAGGTENFFLRLTGAFHDAGIEQGFAIRPGVAWRDEIAPRGQIYEGRYLRHTPRWWAAGVALRRAVTRWRPDAVIAWRAPAARLIPDLPGAAKLVRLGDYPRHLRHFGRVDCLVGNTPGVVAHCEGLGWQGRSEVISNFPPPPGTGRTPRAALDTPEDVPLVCAAARFVPTKGVDTVIRAIAETEHLWLWLVGDGPDRPALEALVTELGIAGRVRFAGWQADITPFIRAADVFCVPSRQEPLGNVVLEGWSCDVPVVTTRTEGPDWFATDGGDCLLVPIDAPREMAAALQRVVGDPALAARLVEGGRATLAERFSAERVVARYVELIGEIRGA
ncbi:glycosyltransferase [Rhodobacterales bacterium HKCCE3408]|nr:glycosyltransferase [Rhodobacterales bacterium HKCCE3408]